MERGAKNDSCNSQCSWSLRKRRSLELAASHPLQSQITDYWKIADTIEQLQHKNEKLSMLLKDLQQTVMMPDQNLVKTKSYNNLIQEIINNADQNYCKFPTCQRYSPTIKNFATALFLYSGPLAYEFLQQNIPQAMPCTRTIQGAIYAQYNRIDEGSFRFDALQAHIERYKTPRCVSISEDATRITGRVEYDHATDRCVGFVLPLDDNRLPIVDSFMAKSFSAMEDMFAKNPIAKYVYIYMAQPLCHNVPPICLACLGTNNKFSAEDLLPRWRYIVEECSRHNISVLSFRADGDSRIMNT